jgi:hypothetical protein
VCWSDTVTTAEWTCEVLETYCWILGLARQLGAPISNIPEIKGSDLMARKKRMGLPDARFAQEGIGANGNGRRKGTNGYVRRSLNA